MHLTVITNGDEKRFEDAWDYMTNPEGELDILSDGVIVATYAAGKWESVHRHKEAMEEWPKNIQPDDEDGEDGEEGSIGFEDVEEILNDPGKRADIIELVRKGRGMEEPPPPIS